MKTFATAALVGTLVAAGIPIGAHAQHGHDRQEMMHRFDRMDRMMDEAQRSGGDARHQHMRQHMQMMHEQMQAMQGMMGGGMGMGGDRDRGTGSMGPRGQMEPGGGDRLQNLENRMDMMQRMMEQMQKQHELMLEDGAADKG